ncbi:MerR family transcriptional regulator [Komagataeibacter sp. AV436]|uniref:MerR family transcriptional regulator n=1 Tax=Komagataeibacter melomenusus TaxID=2766578 RepID=A0ABX2AHM5_9PROT|nr:MerR family transcriptional regulator [Komagataeibacter melomenusus]MBV1832060.1 MerR family transcriptional regulator [Komagataeibacter melomenusus]NPC67871.1 MerR family transcriptional regulator [Komagataeibacter melomenusus]
MTTEHATSSAVEPGTDCLPIYEVARELGLAQHVMRMWEASFPQLQPLRGPVGRRYYRPQDITVLREIADLLYVRKMSVAQAQAELARGALVAPESAGEAVTPPAGAPVAQEDAPVAATAPATEPATAIMQVTVIEDVVETVVACEEPPTVAPPVPEAPVVVETATTAADAAPEPESVAGTPAQAPEDEPEQPPLEQIVMIEVERLQAENTVLRDSLRGVLVELEALRQMVPV